MSTDNQQMNQTANLAPKSYVLLIEDDPFVQKIYQLKFTKYNIKVVPITNGHMAFDYLKKTDVELPGVVLLDLMLPFVSGFEILEEIRKNKRWADVPVIILSNLSQELDLEKARALGVKEYLVKADVRIEDAVQKVMQYLNGSAKN